MNSLLLFVSYLLLFGAISCVLFYLIRMVLEDIKQQEELVYDPQLYAWIQIINMTPSEFKQFRFKNNKHLASNQSLRVAEWARYWKLRGLDESQ